MIDLQDIRYVRLGTRDLAAADRFAREVVGLELARVEAGARYYRSDDRDHTLVYFEGDPADHTVAFELRDGSESLMVLGDSLGNPHVAFEAPGFESGSDQDPAMAAATRRGLLDQLASAQMRVAGFHLPGGLGRVERTGGAFRFVAD